MTAPDTDFDPDDNFEHAFGRPAQIDEEDALETLVWQFMLLVNPGDEDAAMQQFAAWQETSGAAESDDELAAGLLDATDWKSGFRVDESDPAAAIDVLGELAARWDLRIDWGVEDPGDDEFLADAEVPSLIGTAFDRLREHHYTLWTWEPETGVHAGWFTHSRDDDAMRMLVPALGLPLRPGAA
ncbi:hypothetical protein ACFFGH_17775 [Lysobacter korlensis]|uniref:DUF6630 domain-containing protein n=1 Tax=Lysobacter korlensis TaxID=553636 RepID=A0ABV6RRU7_9GAMM